MIIICAVIYPLATFCVAQLLPSRGLGETLTHKGKKHYVHIAQRFNDDRYFQSRPSAVSYNAAGSGGSNKGPSEAGYLKDIQIRIDTFLKHNPSVKKSAIPVDLVTESGSGLDPHISVKAAEVQFSRIAQLHGIKEQQLRYLLQQQVEAPLFGLFGPSKVNVLHLNIALDKLIESR